MPRLNANIGTHLRSFEDCSPELNGPNFHPPFKPSGAEKEPRNISFEAYCEVLASFIDDTRGTNLPGFQAPGTVLAIFRQQSVYWEFISNQYVEDCSFAVLDFLESAVMHVGGRHTGKKLMDGFIHQSLSEIGIKLEQKLTELLWPHQKSHLSTENPKYHSRVSASKKTLCSRNVEGSTDDRESEDQNYVDSWSEIALKLDFQPRLLSAAEALDTTDAYYEVGNSPKR